MSRQGGGGEMRDKESKGKRMQAKPLPLPALDLQWSSRLWTDPFRANGKIGDGRGEKRRRGEGGAGGKGAGGVGGWEGRRRARDGEG